MSQELQNLICLYFNLRRLGEADAGRCLESAYQLALSEMRAEARANGIGDAEVPKGLW